MLQCNEGDYEKLARKKTPPLLREEKNTLLWQAVHKPDHHSIALNYLPCQNCLSNVLETCLEHTKNKRKYRCMAQNEVKLHSNFKTASTCLTSGIALHR